MNLKIMLTNCLVYEDKQTGLKKTRIGYTMAEDQFLQETEKFKGFPELSAFYDSVEPFERIPKDFFRKTVTATVEDQPNPRNPLKLTKIITQLKLDNRVINLL